MDNNKREAMRRVAEACDLIQSAYRLSALYPDETVSAVKAAISRGAQQAAEDVTEALSRV